MKCPVRVCLRERKEIHQKDPGNSNKPEDKKDIGKVCLERQMKNQEELVAFEVKVRPSIQGMVHRHKAVQLRTEKRSNAFSNNKIFCVFNKSSFSRVTSVEYILQQAKKLK